MHVKAGQMLMLFILLLTPIILLILGNYLYKLIARVNKPYRGRNDRI